MFPVTVRIFRNGFLLFIALSMLDLIGWTFPVLLCDYALNMLLIKALFYMFNSLPFRTEATTKTFCIGPCICFHMRVRDGVGC